VHVQFLCTQKRNQNNKLENNAFWYAHVHQRCVDVVHIQNKIGKKKVKICTHHSTKQLTLYSYVCKCNSFVLENEILKKKWKIMHFDMNTSINFLTHVNLLLPRKKSSWKNWNIIHFDTQCQSSNWRSYRDRDAGIAMWVCVCVWERERDAQTMAHHVLIRNVNQVTDAHIEIETHTHKQTWQRQRHVCKRALLKRRHSAKETYYFKEPLNRSHPITDAHVETETLALPCVFVCVWERERHAQALTHHVLVNTCVKTEC